MNSSPQRLPQSGQILIIMLLVMLIGLTTGIYLLGRTTTDVATTSKIEESTRAFNAAEAGVEETIRAGATSTGTATPTPVPFASGLTYQATIADLTATNNLVYPADAGSNTATTIGDVFTVWLVPHNDATGAIQFVNAYNQNTLYVCFSQVSGSLLPALGVTAYYTLSGRYQTSFAGYDPDSTRVSTNHFSSISGGGRCNGTSYNYRATIDLRTDFSQNITPQGGANPVVPVALRIRPVYAPALIGILATGGAGTTTPKQGNQINSTGQAGSTSRKIQVSQPYSIPAPFMDNALYSFGNSDLTKTP